MANNKIRFLRGTSAEYKASSKDKDTFYYTTDTKKLYLGSNEVTGSDLSIDEIIDDTSSTATDKTWSVKKISESVGVGKAGTGENAEIFNNYKDNDASGIYSHAEGHRTTASGNGSHAEGTGTVASGTSAHAGGHSAVAGKSCTFAHGELVEASSNDYEVAFGAFNKSNTDTLFSIGNGTDETKRSNAFEITKTTGKIFDKEIATKEELEAHAADTDIHVTAEEKAGWNEISNPNLLINPDFRINQRGKSEYDAAGYTVDSWRVSLTTKLTTHDEYISLENTTDKGTATFFQMFEDPAVLSGKTVTLSFDCDLKTEGAYVSVQTTINGSWVPSASQSAFGNTGRSVKSVVVTCPEGLTDFRLALVIHSTDTAPLAQVDIYSAKLELGTAATAFTPPDTATELAKCQRYLTVLPSGRYGRAVFVGTNAMQFECNLPVTMRIKPTVVSGTFGTIALNQSSTSQVITDYTTEILSQKNNLLLLQLSKTNGASDCALFATDKILLSAEL